VPLAAPLPVQGTPHTVPLEITGDAGARRTPAIFPHPTD